MNLLNTFRCGARREAAPRGEHPPCWGRSPRNAGRTHTFCAALGTLLLAACSETASDDRITAPVSPQAGQIDGLWTLSLTLGIGVWTIVMALLAVPIVRSWRHHRVSDASGRPERDRAPDGQNSGPGDSGPGAEGVDYHEVSGARRMLHLPPAAILDEPVATADPHDAYDAQRDRQVRARLLWIGGIIGPSLILVVLLIASGAVGASTAHTSRDGELVIDVRGHMFWWEVHYPDQGITTANEIHVPVGQPVRLRLTSEDVIHSFWIPRVHGKIDMIPGTENWLSFTADETGRFRGQCAEFCGIAHAQMVAFLIVEEPDDFSAWVAGQQQDAAAPTADSAIAGQGVFFEAGCASCHAVSGTGAVGRVGPDLTHIGSRTMLGAGIVPNTRASLTDLIIDPWRVKPGNPMPPTQLDDAELAALLDYLEVLE